MKVYRLERPESHQGPYVGQNKDADLIAAFALVEQTTVADEDRPGPWRDFDQYHGDYFAVPVDKIRFGFISPQSAINWFGETLLDLLFSIGFVLQTYEVSEDHYQISNSGKQVVFVHPRL